jgi:hypothetical protein
MREKIAYTCIKSEPGRKKSYTAIIFTAIYFLFVAFLFSGCSKSFTYDPSIGDPLKFSIQSILPVNLADSVFVDPEVSVTFSDETDPAIISSASIILKNGDIPVPGTISSSGPTALFTADSDLAPETEYTTTVKTTPKSNSEFTATHEYSWKFKTGKQHRISSLGVLSVSPGNKTMSVPVDVPLIVTFNQVITATMKSAISLVVKKGTATVDGTLIYSGNTATFQPGAKLADGTAYSVKILVTTKDNTIASANNFSWSFTTAGTAADVIPPVISSVIPANNASSVAVSSKPSVTFSEAMNPTTINSSTFALKQGSASVAGTVSYTGLTATFTPAVALTGGTVYTGTITTGARDAAGNALSASYIWSFTTVAVADVTPPTVLSAVPAAGSISVSTTTRAVITFSEPMNPATISATSVTLKKGTTAVAGAVTYTGSTATFTPTVALDANTVYTGTVTTAAKDVAGNALASNFTWSFTTAAAADVTPPTVLSVLPAVNATSVDAGSKPAVTFSEVMDATSITSSTFTLKHGTTAVTGSVSCSGTTATFTPSSALAGSTIYTGTITTGAKDASGNSIAVTYTWSFTTGVPADVTPPSVISVTPSNNATAVAVNSTSTAVFSEAMSATSITSSTFTMKQGTASVPGAVTYSGTTATFTPSSALAGNTVYTCMLTTGAKDMAGNAMTSAYSWSFTTAGTTPPGLSFSGDVVPILNLCNTCHTHPWTTSPTASTFYTNLVNGGYVNPASPTTSKIYVKLSGGHPPSTVTAAQVTTILTWMTQGSKNN